MSTYLIEQLQQVFRANSHEENIGPMTNYMRNQFSFYGIKSPERRKLSRQFLVTAKAAARERNKGLATDESLIDWQLIDKLWAMPEREYQYIAMDYLKGLEKYLVQGDLPMLERLILNKSWWDTVDMLAKNIGMIVKKYPTEKNTMRQWSFDDNIWLRRAAILHQLNWHGDTDVKLLEEIIANNMGSNDFFINKAIGWALREYAKTDAEWVRTFIDQNSDKLDNLSIREAQKNIIN